MKRSTLIFLIFTVISLSGCGAKMTELKKLEPSSSFTVQASSYCLFQKGVAHVSDYLGLTQPKYDYLWDAEKQYGWFRQPLILIEIKKIGENQSLIERRQTDSSSFFYGQGDELINFLKSNPCKEQ